MTDRQSTHASGCWSCGPKHYECAMREIERLRKMSQDAYQRGLQAGSRGLREAYDAVQEVKSQDAWDNTRLTEALMEAEERAERAEAENKRLRCIISDLKDWDCDVSGGFLSIPLDLRRRMQEAIDAALTAQPAISGAPGCWSWGPKHYECAVGRAERLAEALEEIRKRSAINRAMNPNPFELTALLGDIYQIADSEL